jgi:hypothetical protein
LKQENTLPFFEVTSTRHRRKTKSASLRHFLSLGIFQKKASASKGNLFRLALGHFFFLYFFFNYGCLSCYRNTPFVPPSLATRLELSAGACPTYPFYLPISSRYLRGRFSSIFMCRCGETCIPAVPRTDWTMHLASSPCVSEISWGYLAIGPSMRH